MIIDGQSYKYYIITLLPSEMIQESRTFTLIQGRTDNFFSGVQIF